jgi:hypothetical protein
MTDHLSDYTPKERGLFESLPRLAVPDPALESEIVSRLGEEGLLRSRRPGFGNLAMAIMAAGLVAAAWFGGVRRGAALARESSLEGQLARYDLTTAERILLMQRAGSAYVNAANAYASAVEKNDSTAIEVSSRVLLSAAQAVARTKLDGALAPQIASMLRSAHGSPSTVHPVIWY